MARKILLADDSVTAQNMGRKILADAGYEVITVNNGSAALKKVTEQHPDVIVLDVYMPGYSGLEVCQRLKEAGETSRIPILLTVGKLEPFKPEEAKRVRADAFIIKPFEASELLSALTKLEDKIVPRSEPSKPGRFGRAASALDERAYDKLVAVEEDDSWKSRLSFPPKKKEKEDGASEESQPGKDAHPIAAQAAAPIPEKKAGEEKLDLGALSGAGLPKDVTPEEIAALAAAAARIKGKAVEEKIPAAEMAVVAPARVDEHKSESPVPVESIATPKSMAGPGPIYVPEQKQDIKEPEEKTDSTPSQGPVIETKVVEIKPESKAEEVQTVASVEAAPAAPAQPAEESVTMAVAPLAEAAAARWTAVAVGLAPEESSVSLEQEMQKAFAASAGAESSESIPSSIAVGAAAESVSTQVSPVAEAAATTAEPEPQEPAGTSSGAVTELVSAAVNELEGMASSYAAHSPAAESALAAAQAVASAEASAAAATELSAESDKAATVELKHVEEARADVQAETPTSIPAPESVPVIARDTDASSTKSHGAELVDASAPSPVEPAHKESEVSGSAGGLGSRKHDEGSNGKASFPAEEVSKHGTLKEEAAMAAAVGAKIPVDEKKSDVESDPDVASIVDSVLADLRPKIVQEISRKLGKK